MTQARPAQPDPLEEQLLADFREEIRRAKLRGSGVVEARAVVTASKVTRESYVSCARLYPRESA